MPIPTNLCLIYGSAREGRFCVTVAGWVRDELKKRADFQVSVVDPLDAGSAGERAATLAAADAFIVVTPEYNH